MELSRWSRSCRIWIRMILIRETSKNASWKRKKGRRRKLKSLLLWRKKWKIRLKRQLPKTKNLAQEHLSGNWALLKKDWLWRNSKLLFWANQPSSCLRGRKLIKLDLGKGLIRKKLRRMTTVGFKRICRNFLRLILLI